MRRILSVAAVILALCMVFSLAACGGNKAGSTADSAKIAETEVTGDAALLKSYFEGDAFQKQKESIREALKDKMDVEFTADGTTMVITYTFKQKFMDTSFPGGLTDELKEKIKESMEEYLNGQEETVKPMIDELKKLGLSDPTVRIEVLGPDGTDYGSKTF